MMSNSTPLKTNMDPENHWFVEECALLYRGTIRPGSILVSTSVVRLLRCRSKTKQRHHERSAPVDLAPGDAKRRRKRGMGSNPEGRRENTWQEERVQVKNGESGNLR